jgi:hypothetical protein
MNSKVVFCSAMVLSSEALFRDGKVRRSGEMLWRGIVGSRSVPFGYGKVRCGKATHRRGKVR